MEKKYSIEDFSGLGFFGTKTNHCVPVPSEEIFWYIKEKAMAGNEMATVQLYEWMVLCIPKSSSEEKIYHNINNVFNKIINT